MVDVPKIKVSKEQFAEALFYWLAKQVNTKAIKQTAKLFDIRDKEHKDSSEPEKLFGLNLRSKKDFNKLVEELLDLNMWLIVRACERVFEDIDKRNECLDIFHHIVYERLIEETKENRRQWMLSMTAKYIDYNKATETEHPSGPAWVLATAVNKNLFGEVNPDALVQFHIGAYVAESIKALEEAIKQYDIQ